MNVKSLGLAIAATLLLVGAAQAANLVSDPTFTDYGTQALSYPGVGSYFQTNILADWTTPASTLDFLYLSGHGNASINQNTTGTCTPVNGGGSGCFALWNSTQTGGSSPSTTTGAQAWCNTANCTSIVNPPHGGNFIVADGGSGDTQSFSTNVSVVSGKTYQLTFYQAAGQQAGYGIGPPQTGINDRWMVTLNGSASQLSTEMIVPFQGFGSMNNGGSFQSGVWEEITMTFVATLTGSETLTFLSDSSTNGSLPPFALLADVSLVQVPEPVSLGIMGLGLLGLGVVARKRMKKRANQN